MKQALTTLIGALAVIIGGTTTIPLRAAQPLSRATVTQLKNDVRYRPADGTERPAKVSDVVQGSDVLRTGVQSLAEVRFEDKTLARIGSNTIFSFKEGTREMELHSGLMLFHVPKGAGGAKIRTRAATAAITGTTGLSEAQQDMLKIILLEGKAHVELQGKMVPVDGGDMLIVYSNGNHVKTPIDLNTLVNTSTFLKEAQASLQETDSEGNINKTIEQQQKELQQGTLEQTNYYIAGTGDAVLSTGSGGESTGTLADSSTADATTGTGDTQTASGDGGTTGGESSTMITTIGMEANTAQTTTLAFYPVGEMGIIRGQAIWGSIADLDLELVLPGGAGTVSLSNPLIFFNSGQAFAQLDNDNVGALDPPDASGLRVENIFVQGLPLTGNYTFNIINFSSYDFTAPTSVTLRVTADNGKTIQDFNFVLSEGQSASQIVTHTVP